LFVIVLYKSQASLCSHHPREKTPGETSYVKSGYIKDLFRCC